MEEQKGKRTLWVLLMLIAPMLAIGLWASGSSGYSALPGKKAYEPQVSSQSANLNAPKVTLQSAQVAAPQATPGTGTISPSGASVTWTGTATGGAAPNGEPDCIEGVNCDTFTLTLSGSVDDWEGKLVRARINWLLPANDYDLVVHKDSNEGPITGSSGSAATTEESVMIDPHATGVGVYTIHAIYYAATNADQYSGTAEIDAPAVTPTPVPGSGPPAIYQNYTGPRREPGVMEGAEPTLGINWQTGSVMYLALLKALRVNFDDCFAPARAAWAETNQVLSNVESLDPIIVTDHVTNRTFVHQLTLNGGLSEYTDDDGETYFPMEGGRANEGVDHQALDSGPYVAGSGFPLPGQTYPHAVYYCSQSVAAAFCARSDNGGVTFNPGVPIYTVADCGATFGLHGHVKVSPDGTVYVPKPGCDGLAADNQQVVSVSENNGLTWQVRPIPGTTSTSFSDPSVGIASDGTVYVGMQNGDNRALVSVSRDKGLTWSTPYDVGAQVGVIQSVFPAVVAGDPDRAAMTFIGTSTAGDYQAESFTGEWHVYVAHTYDGGETWITTDITPIDPVQRRNICGSGACRNLLDFYDADVDREGRVLIAYADGCIGNCVTTQLPADGSPGFRERGIALARQSGGRRLFAQYDPVDPTVPDPPARTFVDVPVSNTFSSFIQCLVCKGIVSGYADGTFRPGADVTRGQLAKIVSNSAGYVETINTQTYEDVAVGSPFHQFIERLTVRGVMGGYPCGGPNEPCGSGNKPYFRTNANATRGQISKIVSNGAGYNDPQTGQTYEDVPTSNTFHVFIERLSSRGVMGGYTCGGPGEPCGTGNKPYFRPNTNATRGQTSKIVANTFFPNCEEVPE